MEWVKWLVEIAGIVVAFYLYFRFVHPYWWDRPYSMPPWYIESKPQSIDLSDRPEVAVGTAGPGTPTGESLRDMSTQMSIEAGDRVYRINAVGWHNLIDDLMTREGLARDQYRIAWSLQDLVSGHIVPVEAVVDRTSRPTQHGLGNGARLRLVRLGGVEKA